MDFDFFRTVVVVERSKTSILTYKVLRGAFQWGSNLNKVGRTRVRSNNTQTGTHFRDPSCASGYPLCEKSQNAQKGVGQISE